MTKTLVSSILALGIALTVLSGCTLLMPPPPEGLNEQQIRGWTIYIRRCAACHRINGKGGGSARELTHVASRRNEKSLRRLLKDPKEKNSRVKMPPPKLSKAQIDDVVEYLLSLE